MNQQQIEHTRAFFSFEIFPPKRDMPLDTVYRTLDDLADLAPDFISVTCGAGGSSADASSRTIELAASIRERYRREGVAHMPCINLSRSDAADMLGRLDAAGVNKILALRGDRVEGVEPKHDFLYASDLVEFIRREAGDRFQIFAACYPEGHIEAPSPEADLRFLKQKVDAGVDRLISQLFFNNEFFYRFQDRAREIGIDIPIEAGIMPVTNKKQIERMVTLCGATLPRKFQRVLAKYGSRPEAMRDAGIALAIDQIVELLAHGVDGIHLYTMNNPLIARRITEAVRTLL